LPLGFTTQGAAVVVNGVLSMVVPLAVFFAFQKYFVQGVLAGSVR
jgi:ABC-type glycerol-3-phosphate transport system permease component